MNAKAGVNDAIIEGVTMLQLACDNKLDNWEAKLRTSFLHPSAHALSDIPSIRPLCFGRGLEVRKGEDAAPRVAQAVDIFLSGNNPLSTDFKTVAGLGELVKSAVKALLGHASVGDTEAETTFVCFLYNAFIRVDLKMYRYRFTSRSFKAVAESAVAYFFCISVIDEQALVTTNGGQRLKGLAYSDADFARWSLLNDQRDIVLAYIRRLRSAEPLESPPPQPAQPVAKRPMQTAPTNPVTAPPKKPAGSGSRSSTAPVPVSKPAANPPREGLRALLKFLIPWI